MLTNQISTKLYFNIKGIFYTNVDCNPQEVKQGKMTLLKQ